jgi:DNA-binding transcriptional LysR family regulator
MYLRFTIETMIIDPFDGVTAFLAVAETASFTAAASRLAVTPTAVSKSIRQLEGRLGVVLFQRTTRRVALTDAGQAAFLRLRPAAVEVAEAFAALSSYQQRPMGTLRITAPRTTLELFSALVPAFRMAHPEVTLDVSLDDAIVDLIADGFDAGLRLGEAIERDMVAVRLSPPIAWAIVGSPGYFERRSMPRRPEDLVSHEAIRYRFQASKVVHRWGFKRGRREFVVDVNGALIVDDRRLLVDLATQGLGLAFVSEREASAPLADGRLLGTLQSFIPVDTGLYLYFPERSQQQLKLRAFIDLARVVAARVYG